MNQHVPKGLTKKVLYTFIDKACEKRSEQLRTEYRPQLVSLIEPIMNKLLPHIQKYQQAKDIIDDVPNSTMYALSNWNNSVDRFNNVSKISHSIESLFRNNLQSKANVLVQLNWDQIHVNDVQELNQLVDSWNKVIDEFDVAMKDARTLSRELTAIVQSERKADKAFVKLDRLGLDMTDIVELKPDAFLPAPIQPSVPVSIFNVTAKKANAEE